MVIGRFDPKQARQTTTLKQAIRIGLDEALTALAESFHDLTDERFWAFPLPGRHNVVTLVEHCIQCLDLYACEVQNGKLTFEPEKRFDIWHHSAEELRPLMVDLPTVARQRRWLDVLREAILRTLDETADEDLLKPRPCWWFEEQPEKVSADAYMRCICHTMAHVRQIWLMRGLMGLTDQDGWPEQHWA